MFEELLEFDAERELDRIVEWLRTAVRDLKRRGAIVGVSGGIDSSVVLSLCAAALEPNRVLAVLSPERDSSGDTIALSRLAVAQANVQSVEHDLTPILESFGCYALRDDAVQSLVPEYTPEWKMKIVLPPMGSGGRLRLFTLVAESPSGERVSRRLTADVYRGVLAAMNFKQRGRKVLEYYHADRLSYAVAGTPNRLEYDQGFFVKNGDGAADIKPIAHLYKTQVIRLSEALGVPEEIRDRVPTTDTYSLPQTQEEFFFSLPLRTLDICLFARDRGIAAQAVGEVADLSTDEVGQVFAEIDAKRKAAAYLHAAPVLVESI